MLGGSCVKNENHVPIANLVSNPQLYLNKQLMITGLLVFPRRSDPYHFTAIKDNMGRSFPVEPWLLNPPYNQIYLAPWQLRETRTMNDYNGKIVTLHGTVIAGADDYYEFKVKKAVFH